MMSKEYLPCPFCGSNDLSTDRLWTTDAGEERAIECITCFSGALEKTWNKRDGTFNQELEVLHNQQPLLLEAV